MNQDNEFSPEELSAAEKAVESAQVVMQEFVDGQKALVSERNKGIYHSMLGLSEGAYNAVRASGNEWLCELLIEAINDWSWREKK